VKAGRLIEHGAAILRRIREKKKQVRQHQKVEESRNTVTEKKKDPRWISKKHPKSTKVIKDTGGEGGCWPVSSLGDSGKRRRDLWKKNRWGGKRRRSNQGLINKMSPDDLNAFLELGKEKTAQATSKAPTQNKSQKNSS